jgi:hypothetical protein
MMSAAADPGERSLSGLDGRHDRLCADFLYEVSSRPSRAGRAADWTDTGPLRLALPRPGPPEAPSAGAASRNAFGDRAPLLTRDLRLRGVPSAAAPFFCRIALDEATKWRAALTIDLALTAIPADAGPAVLGAAVLTTLGARPLRGAPS